MEYYIEITYCGQTQSRKIKQGKSKQEAEQILESLYMNDDLGCELFSLYSMDTSTGEVNLVSEFEY